jgi:hypothetical protein
MKSETAKHSVITAEVCVNIIARIASIINNHFSECEVSKAVAFDEVCVSVNTLRANRRSRYDVAKRLRI